MMQESKDVWIMLILENENGECPSIKTKVEYSFEDAIDTYNVATIKMLTSLKDELIQRYNLSSSTGFREIIEESKKHGDMIKIGCVNNDGVYKRCTVSCKYADLTKKEIFINLYSMQQEDTSVTIVQTTLDDIDSIEDVFRVRKF